MVAVGRHLCNSNSPPPPLNQVHLDQAAQDLVQVGFEYLQRRRLHNPSGQPVQVLRHPQREEVLPHVQTELPVPQFVPKRSKGFVFSPQKNDRYFRQLNICI